LYRALTARAARTGAEDSNNRHHQNPFADSSRNQLRYSQPPPYTPADYHDKKELNVGRSNSVGTAQNKPALAPKPLRQDAKLEAVALYDFSGEQPGDLSFRKDDIITIIKKSESTNDWWTGKLNEQEGIVSIVMVSVVVVVLSQSLTEITLLMRNLKYPDAYLFLSFSFLVSR
jgi:SH3 domain-containing YSC84-like protein 1